MAWPAMLVPERDLKGATPEALARALFRNENPALRPGAGGQAVVCDEVAAEKVASLPACQLRFIIPNGLSKKTKKNRK